MKGNFQILTIYLPRGRISSIFPLSAPVFLFSSSLFIFVKVLITKMKRDQPQRTPSTDKRCKRRKKRKKRKCTPPLYNEFYGDDYTMCAFVPIIIRDLFWQYVAIKYSGDYRFWTFKGSQRDTLRIQLQLSWVNIRSLELNNPNDLVREIVTRYQQHFRRDTTCTFDHLYSDVRFSIPDK